MSDAFAIDVVYPVSTPVERLVLRTDLDWERDVEPIAGPRGDVHRFEVPSERPFLYFKPVIVAPDGRERTRWSHGENFLVTRGEGTRTVYPHFDSAHVCGECSSLTVPSRPAGDGIRVRVFEPEGYRDNPLARWPVVFMQDGQNLFFDDEAFQGRSWRVQDSMSSLAAMSLIEPAIVVGVYPEDRMRQYTQPGYDAFARSLAEDLVPWVDATYRTRVGPGNRSVIGSSLGGVVSFFAAWQHPDVFGSAACLSSTFGHENDLLERVAREPRRPIRLYLDSGWPNDNFEVTLAMRDALLARGYRPGDDLVHFAFPRARHDESAWSSRLHLPLQFLLRRRVGATEKRALLAVA